MSKDGFSFQVTNIIRLLTWAKYFGKSVQLCEQRFGSSEKTGTCTHEAAVVSQLTVHRSLGQSVGIEARLSKLNPASVT